jgi:cytoplasmic iron level regulating protein YaaA (DUF328/UPF0246 family)
MVHSCDNSCLFLNKNFSMKILLSPAKSIDTNIEVDHNSFTFPVFHKEATLLAGKLAQLSERKIMDLMSVSPQIAQLNVERYKNFKLTNEPGEQNKAAGFIFTGEVYKGLNLSSLDKKHYNTAQNNIRILSGLYGILKPFDLIYPYRLEMGTSWQITPKTKNLYAFWGDKVAKQLAEEMKQSEVLINLASNEYFKVIPKNSIEQRIITPVFKEFKGDKYSTVMMYAKHARGAMARYIIENNIEDAEQLKLYNVDGYQFHENLSSENEWVFTR